MADNTNEYNIVSKLKRKISNTKYEDYYLGPELKYVGALLRSGNNNLEEQLLMGENQIVTTWVDGGVEKKVIEFRPEEVTDNYYILEYSNFSNPIMSYVENKALFILNRSKDVIKGESDYTVDDENLYISDKIFYYDAVEESLSALRYSNIFEYRGKDTNPDLFTYDIENEQLDVIQKTDVPYDYTIVNNTLNIKDTTYNYSRSSDNIFHIQEKYEENLTIHNIVKMIASRTELKYKKDGNIIPISMKEITKEKDLDGKEITKEYITNYL